MSLFSFFRGSDKKRPQAAPKIRGARPEMQELESRFALDGSAKPLALWGAHPALCDAPKACPPQPCKPPADHDTPGCDDKGSNGKGSGGKGSDCKGSNGKGSDCKGSHGKGSGGKGSQCKASGGKGSGGKGSHGKGSDDHCDKDHKKDVPSAKAVNDLFAKKVTYQTKLFCR